MTTAMKTKSSIERREIAAQFERERKHDDALMNRELRTFARRLRNAIVNKVSRGEDFKEAIQPTLDRMQTMLADAMTLGYLRGRERSYRMWAAHRNAMQLSTYDHAISTMLKRLALTHAQKQILVERYDTFAAELFAGFGEELEQKITENMLKAIQQDIHVRGGKRLVREAVKGTGIDEKPWLLENMYRTNTQLAYASGQWQANQDPDIDDIIWGYEYVATPDDRVRPNHMALDGLKFRKDDPRLSKIAPPNGYQCRCQLIEIYKDDPDAVASDFPDQVMIDGAPALPEADQGFEFNPGEVFGENVPDDGGKGKEKVKKKTGKQTKPKPDPIEPPKPKPVVVKPTNKKKPIKVKPEDVKPDEPPIVDTKPKKEPKPEVLPKRESKKKAAKKNASKKVAAKKREQEQEQKPSKPQFKTREELMKLPMKDRLNSYDYGDAMVKAFTEIDPEHVQKRHEQAKAIKRLKAELLKLDRKGKRRKPEDEKRMDELIPELRESIKAYTRDQRHIEVKKQAHRVYMDTIKGLPRQNYRYPSKDTKDAPAAWNKGLERINDLVVKNPGDPDRFSVTAVGFEVNRSGYDIKLKDLKIDPRDDHSVIMHEWMHVIEDQSPDAFKSSLDFLKHRRGDEKKKSIKKLYKVGMDTEYGIEDDFEKAHFGSISDGYPVVTNKSVGYNAIYTGKIYEYSEGREYATEVMSMGIQLFEDDPAGFAQRDPEYFKFVVGWMRGDLR